MATVLPRPPEGMVRKGIKGHSEAVSPVKGHSEVCPIVVTPQHFTIRLAKLAAWGWNGRISAPSRAHPDRGRLHGCTWTPWTPRAAGFCSQRLLGCESNPIAARRAPPTALQQSPERIYGMTARPEAPQLRQMCWRLALPSLASARWAPASWHEGTATPAAFQPGSLAGRWLLPSPLSGR